MYIYIYVTTPWYPGFISHISAPMFYRNEEAVENEVIMYQCSCHR